MPYWLQFTTVEFLVQTDVGQWLIAYLELKFLILFTPFTVRRQDKVVTIPKLYEVLVEAHCEFGPHAPVGWVIHLRR